MTRVAVFIDYQIVYRRARQVLPWGWAVPARQQQSALWLGTRLRWFRNEPDDSRSNHCRRTAMALMKFGRCGLVL